MGTIPGAQSQLTIQIANAQNETAGPFLARMPLPPGTAPANYAIALDSVIGTFQISAAGDSATVLLP